MEIDRLVKDVRRGDRLVFVCGGDLPRPSSRS